MFRGACAIAFDALLSPVRMFTPHSQLTPVWDRHIPSCLKSTEEQQV